MEEGNKMISKELWSAVNNKPLPSHLKLFGKKDVTAVVGDDMISINIYELMSKCKVWAINEYNIIMETRVYADDMYMVTLRENNDHTDFIRKSKKETEQEAVFKLCEYILKERAKIIS